MNYIDDSFTYSSTVAVRPKLEPLIASRVVFTASTLETGIKGSNQRIPSFKAGSPMIMAGNICLVVIVR